MAHLKIMANHVSLLGHFIKLYYVQYQIWQIAIDNHILNTLLGKYQQNSASIVDEI